jgi:hypothetical protein
MKTSKTFTLLVAVGFAFLLTPSSTRGQTSAAGTLQNAKSIRCTFSLYSIGTWTGDQAKAEVKPRNQVLEFTGINTDEGTAEQKATGTGKYDIIVRYAGGYLHFIQSFLNGPLYTTTVLEKKTPNGKFKAMHSRHEFTDFALPGFTSSPEQYYGDCEVIQ